MTTRDLCAESDARVERQEVWGGWVFAVSIKMTISVYFIEETTCSTLLFRKLKRILYHDVEVVLRTGFPYPFAIDDFLRSARHG